MHAEAPARAFGLFGSVQPLLRAQEMSSGPAVRAVNTGMGA